MTEAAAQPQTDNAVETDAVETDNDELDALTLSALLSSRVCHDLINPVGAVGSGLDVLDDPEMDGTMRDAAMDLIQAGAKKAIALLSYARLAYGAAGGLGAQISLEDARKVIEDVYAIQKPDLVWELGGELAPKENVKVILILANAAADCVPRGGTVTLSGAIDNFEITATGKKVILNEDLVRALQCDAQDIAPKFAPALIAARMVSASGGEMSATLKDDVITFRAAFGQDGAGDADIGVE